MSLLYLCMMGANSFGPYSFSHHHQKSETNIHTRIVRGLRERERERVVRQHVFSPVTNKQIAFYEIDECQ